MRSCLAPCMPAEASSVRGGSCPDTKLLVGSPLNSPGACRCSSSDGRAGRGFFLGRGKGGSCMGSVATSSTCQGLARPTPCSRSGSSHVTCQFSKDFVNYSRYAGPHLAHSILQCPMITTLLKLKLDIQIHLRNQHVTNPWTMKIGNYLQHTPWRFGPKKWICWLDSRDSSHKPADSGRIFSLKCHFEPHACIPIVIQCLLHQCSLHTKLSCTGTGIVHHLKLLSSNSQCSCF